MAGAKPGRKEQIERRDAEKSAAREKLQARPNETLKRQEAVAKLEAVAKVVADPLGLEVVEVEWKGSGRNQLLRIYIDKPAGVTHTDCELMSHQVSTILDADDPIPGAYELEVSSPGLERKLKSAADWRRFTGQKAKVVLKNVLSVRPVGELPLVELKYFDGTIRESTDSSASSANDPLITVELAGGRNVTFPLSQVDRANLKFEW